MTEPAQVKCACFYFDLDPAAYDEFGVATCFCGHTDDEHDEFGECQAEVPAI